MSVAHASRQKISTTISPDSLAYLEQLIDRKQARTLAEAIDLAIGRLLTYENRERLAEDTAAYFDRMTPELAAEEEQLGAALARSVKGIDFDREP